MPIERWRELDGSTRSVWTGDMKPLRQRTYQELYWLANDPDFGHHNHPATDPVTLRALACLMIERWGRYLGYREAPDPLYRWLLAENLIWELSDKNYARYSDRAVAWAIRTRDQLDADEPMPLT